MKTCFLILFLGLAGCASDMLKSESFRSRFIPEDPRERYAQTKDDKDDQEESVPIENCVGWCGYITTIAYTELPDFKKDCKVKKISQKKCWESYWDMVSARLQLQYPQANFNQAVLWCRSQPKECDISTIEGQNNLEVQLILSHNKKTEEIAQQRQAVIEERNAEESRRRMQALGMALQQMGRSVQQQPYMIPQQKQTNCTSQMIGNQMHTNCQGN